MSGDNERKWFMEWIDRLILENLDLKHEIERLKAEKPESRIPWSTAADAVSGQRPEIPLIPLPISLAQKIGFHPLILPVEDLVETLLTEFPGIERERFYDPKYSAGVQAGIKFVVERFFPQNPKAVPEDDGG